MMGTVTKCGRIRRLTPRECFRLQGFPDGLYERAAAVNSETQLYKQAGNAVTATVAYAVAMALPESRELLAQMEAVWEEFGDSMREVVWGGSDDFVRETAWEDFCDSVEEMESRNFNDYSVSGTARDDFGSIEKEETAGEVPGDAGAESGGDFDFLD